VLEIVPRITVYVSLFAWVLTFIGISRKILIGLDEVKVSRCGFL
jgi:hypothetical protein